MTPIPPLRVLLVEPSQSQRELASIFLGQTGLEVRSAGRGPEAVMLAEDFRPQVILTELILPGFSGLELIRRCKARQKEVIIWVLTSATGTWAAQAALSAGADFIFYKPVCFPELRRHLERLRKADPVDRLADALARLGLPDHWTGFHQTLRCLQLLSGPDGKDLLLKELYIQIAREEGCSPASAAKNVERAVRLLRASPLLPPGLSPELSNKDFLFSLSQGAIIPL